MTLEQTINADAASRLTGITAFHQNIPAKNRWTITRSVRAAVVGELINKAGMYHGEETHKELGRSRVDRDHTDLQKLTDGILATSNPFTGGEGDPLRNIATGKVASKKMQDDLLSFEQKAHSLYDDFKQGCFVDPARFERSISQTKLDNFASEAISMKVSAKDLKVQEIKFARDLFGRLVYLATTMSLDMKKVFAYPLTPVPLSFGHMDGTKHTSAKAKLANYLTLKVNSEQPPSFDAYVVDAMYLIRSLNLKDMSGTYGDIALQILRKICIAPRVDFVCDTYRSPSIKNAEQKKRGASDLDITITGPSQKRPKDLKGALISSKFKSELLSFFSTEWSKDTYAEVLRGHDLYVSCGVECFYCTSSNGSVIRSSIDSLRNEQADTRIVLHLMHATNLNPDSVAVVRCNDTDVLCILLHHMKRLSAKVYVDTGFDRDNTRRYINVTKLSKEIGSMCNVLPALHAFS